MSRRRCKTFAGCSMTNRSTRFRWPLPITGTRLITIWACQAGKDVYVEKPCSHNVHEGRVAVAAARRYNRIVQHGTQNRSSQEWALAAAAVHSGKLGKLLVSRALCYKPRGSIGVKPTADPPAEVAFDIWLGPAPKQSYHRQPCSLQLALVLGFRQWRHREPRRSRDGQGSLADPVAERQAHGKSATYPKTVLSLGGPLRLS